MTIDKKSNSLKILLLGDAGTGKTSLLSRLTKDEFNLTCDYISYHNTHDFQLKESIVRADFLQLADREQYRALTSFLHGATFGVLLMYDISNAATFDNIAAWLKVIREANTHPNIVINLVGCKNDLQNQRQVPIEKAEKYAADHNLSFIETSAWKGSNVHRAFESIVQEMATETTSVPENPMNDAPSTISKSLHGVESHNQQQTEPFQIVLIDIKQASDNFKIVCVEKPLEDTEDLAFVALSYRWGEVPEQCIDTGVGYMASITSFHLDDFYDLCWSIRQDPEFEAMKYVWVDAICVNQLDPAKRKATIYQMSNIYQRANYILAVPDLHLTYLKNVNTASNDAINNVYDHRYYIYYLIHGRFDEIAWLDEDWLSQKNLWGYAEEKSAVYDNKGLIDCLQEYRRSFGRHGMSFDLCKLENTTDILQHLEIAIKSHHRGKHKNCSLCSLRNHLSSNDDKKMEPTIQHDKVISTLFKEINYEDGKQSSDEQIKGIEHAMHFLEDLFKDWSSRVWVISEYHIGKQKKTGRMKFWFLSLGRVTMKLGCFKFEFSTTPWTKIRLDRLNGTDLIYDVWMEKFASIYDSFQQSLTHRLHQQSFVEKMLKSKASRNEDRFYAIFPTSEYKDKLTNKDQVDSWHIGNLISVKLKLYELLTTRDKLEMLFLAGVWTQGPSRVHSFPTFATVDFDWDKSCFHSVSKNYHKYEPSNFDLDNNDTIQLIHANTSHSNQNGTPCCKLKLKAKIYYVCDRAPADKPSCSRNIMLKPLEIDRNAIVVFIPMFKWPLYTEELSELPLIQLAGNFEENRWVINDYETVITRHFEPCYRSHYTDDDFSFNIY